MVPQPTSDAPPSLPNPPDPARSYLLQTVFQGEVCAWCYLSAGLSFSLLAAVAGGMGPKRLQASAAPGAGALMTSLAVLYFGFTSSSSAQISELAYYVSPAWMRPQPFHRP